MIVANRLIRTSCAFALGSFVIGATFVLVAPDRQRVIRFVVPSGFTGIIRVRATNTEPDFQKLDGRLIAEIEVSETGHAASSVELFRGWHKLECIQHNGIRLCTDTDDEWPSGARGLVSPGSHNGEIRYFLGSRAAAKKAGRSFLDRSDIREEE